MNTWVTNHKNLAGGGARAASTEPCRARPSAFTLIELLVVIGIIGILAALLLSALSVAKQKVRRTQCISIQRQWALAFLQYPDDNDGWLPREGYHDNGEVYWNNWAHVRNPASRDVWYNTLPGNYLTGKYPASNYALPDAKLAFYEPASFFHCPNARFPNAAKSSSYGIALFSIAMNSQLIEPPDVPTVQLNRIANPSHTVLLLDNLLDEETPVAEEQERDNLGQPAAFANRFAGRRHGNTGVMSFADGHVEAVRGNKVVETKGPNAGGPILPPVDIYWDTE